MDDMNPMEAEVDLENHRHEDEFSPDFEDEELSSEPFVETNDGDVDTLPQMNMLEHASMEMLAGRVLSNEQAQAMRKRLLLERAVSDMLEGK